MSKDHIFVKEFCCNCSKQITVEDPELIQSLLLLKLLRNKIEAGFICQKCFEKGEREERDIEKELGYMNKTKRSRPAKYYE